MNYQKLFNLIIIVTLLMVGLLVSLVGLAKSAQAASAPIVITEKPRLILPPAAPPEFLLVPLVADLSITKTNGVTTIIPGLTTTYTITVTNEDDDDTVNATVTDAFPAQLTGVTWTCSGTSGTTCAPSGSGDINDTTVILPPFSSVTYVVTGTVSAGATGSLVNTASVAPQGGVTDPNSSNDSATDTDTLTPQANLSITKTNNQTATVPGLSTTYIIVVSNSSGPSVITGATVTDSFPASLGSVTWTRSGSGGSCLSPGGSGNINCTVNLPVGGSVTFTATGTVNSGATGSLTNTATITVPGGASDPTPGNNSATDIDTLTPQANLSITKTNGQSSTVPGEQTTYTIVAANSGPSGVTGATVADTFPSMSGVTWNCSGSGGGTCPGSGSGNLNQAVNLPPGGSVTFSATGTVSPAARGSLTNTATVTVPVGASDPTPGNNSATDVDTLTPEADLQLTKSDSPTTVIAGNLLTYTISIFNSGPSDRTDVKLTDFLPAQVTFLSSTPGSPTCAPIGSTVECNWATIPSGDTVQVTIRVRVNSSTPAGSILNTAVVEGDDDEVDPGGNNTDNETTSIQVRSDLTISKTDSPDPAALGASLTYTLRITNIGPSDASGVSVTDPLPGGAGGVNFVSATPSQGSCSGTTTVNCNLNTISGGGVATVTIVVSPKATGTLNNSASVSSSSTDPNTGNNSDSETTTVNRVTDLSITNSDSPDPIISGNNLTYNLTVTNNGPSDATSVTVTHNLPAGASFQSVTPGAPTCTHASGTITCNLGPLAKNSNASISVVVNVNLATAGNISSTANVAAGGSSDPNSANNSSTATTFVRVIYHLRLPIIASPIHTILSVFNDNTGGFVTFTVLGTSVSCTVPDGATQLCGTFPAGIYTVQATATCGTGTETISYPAGPYTNRIHCNN